MEESPCFHLRIKVMADYGTSGIWCEDCGMLEHQELELPAEFSQRIDAWIATYNESIERWLLTYGSVTVTVPDFGSPPLDVPEVLAAFNREGFAIASEVKERLRGSGRAVYYWLE